MKSDQDRAVNSSAVGLGCEEGDRRRARRACLPALSEISAQYPGRLEVISGDALAVDWTALGLTPPVRIVANLPYNIATVLLTGWLEAEPWPPIFESFTLMFQREVAERIVATPAQPRDYGRLAVLCGWRTRAKILFDVSASAFTPRRR